MIAIIVGGILGLELRMAKQFFLAKGHISLSIFKILT